VDRCPTFYEAGAEQAKRRAVVINKVRQTLLIASPGTFTSNVHPFIAAGAGVRRCGAAGAGRFNKVEVLRSTVNIVMT